MNWLQNQIRARINGFRAYNNLPLLQTPEEIEAAHADEHLDRMHDRLAEIMNGPDPEPRVIQPRLAGDVEDVAEGMAVLNGLDWMQMTETERQPYREAAADQLISHTKDEELARQAELEKEGAFDGLDGH